MTILLTPRVEASGQLPLQIHTWAQQRLNFFGLSESPDVLVGHDKGNHLLIAMIHMQSTLLLTSLSVLMLGCQSTPSIPSESPASPSASLVAVQQTPSYSGQIGHYDLGQRFSDFLFDHDGQVVYLDVFFTDEPVESPYAVSYGEDWFSLWTDCEGQTAPGAPSADVCLGVSINVESAGQPGVIWGYNQGAQYLKGYWLVTAHPGMHQGQLSLTLSGAPAQ